MPRALTPEEKAAKVEAARETVRKDTDRPTRKSRGLFNGTSAKLGVQHQIPGYRLYIFNDTPGRIEQALQADYEFVSPDEIGSVGVNVVSRNTDIGDKVRFLVGTDAKGEAQYAYLMKIRQEFFEEDQALLAEKVDRVDNAIRGGKLTGDGQTTDGFYVPKEGIKMR